jgi:hypothetical protein
LQDKKRGRIIMKKDKKSVGNLQQQDELKELDNLEDLLEEEDLEKMDQEIKS